MFGFLSVCSTKRLDTYSAAAAFYIFVSFIPYLLIILSTIKYLPFTKQDLLAFLGDLLPGGTDWFVERMADEMYEKGIGVLSFSVIAVVWASAKGVFGITRGLNDIFDIKVNYGMWYLRARSALCTLLLMIGMILMLVISVFGNTIITIVNRHITIPDTVISLMEAKNIIMFFVLFTVFMFFFCVLPGRKIKPGTQVIGAAIAGMLWIGFTKLFSYYLSTFNGYSMYGSFAVILIIGVWLYSGMYIMFMGALLNKTIASRKGNKNERQDQGT